MILSFLMGKLKISSIYHLLHGVFFREKLLVKILVSSILL